MDELNFIFKMPDDETLAKYISIKGEKGEKGDPTKLSQLDNDTGFVTASTDALTNYYTKAQTDSTIETGVSALKTELGVPAGFFTDASETVTGEGSLITLNDTANAVFKDIKLYGDALQQGTPTPENPVDVQVVTGEQTIIISGNGQQSQSYTLSLGDIKLCKLGSYQDYIYKGNDGWYLHKETDHATIDSLTDGTDYSISTSSTNTTRVLINKCLNGQGIYSPEASRLLAKCEYLQAKIMWSSDQVGFFIDTNEELTKNGLCFRINKATIGTDSTSVEAWLNENPLEVYYVLATATDELITDPALTGQLGAIEKAKSYDETTTVSISGSLASPLAVEAFTNNWSGTTAGINNELANIYTKTEVDNLLGDEVRFIFPKFWPNVFSGDCNLIKYGDKNILIDCYNWTSWNHVKDMLDSNRANHIDYLIITHYHGDHEGNLENLIANGYVDSDTVIYMSAQVTTYAQSYLDEMAARIALLENNNLAYSIPQEGQILRIGNKLKFTFYNCDKNILDAYTAKDQNSCSTCIFIEHGDIKAFYSGDAGKEVFERLAGLGLPKSTVNLYKIAHHGINQVSHPEFIRLLSPEFAVQPSGIMDAVKNNYGVSEEIAVLKELGTKIYSTYMQNEYLCFESDGSSIQCLSGRPFSTSNQRISLTYYVDKTASTNAIQDGTQEHPFSEVMQAVSTIPFKNAMNVTINVAAGYYGNAHEDSWQKNVIQINANRDVLITINGDSSDHDAVILNGIGAWGSVVNLNNLVVDLDNRNGIHVFETDLFLTNVTIKSRTDTAATGHSAIVARQNCHITADNLRIEQCDACIVLSHCSKFAARGSVEIGTHSSVIANVDMDSELITGANFSFDSSSDKLAFTHYNANRTTPVQIMKSHAAMAQTIELITSAANFDWIEIFYRSYDNIYGSTGRIYAPNGKYAALFIPYGNASQVVFNKQARAYINGTAITLDRNYQVTLANNGTQNIETQTTTGFSIERVIGGYGNDYIDITS